MDRRNNAHKVVFHPNAGHVTLHAQPQWRSLSFRVCWKGRRVAIRITGRTVRATLVEGEGMHVRIGATTGKLAEGTTLELSI